MYDDFYGLKGRPFQLTPDPHFFFESATHRKALSYLGYGMAQGEGFIVITGDIGAGKTTLVGHVMATIDPARLTAANIVSTQVEGDDLLRLVAQQFGIGETVSSKAQILQRIEAYLHAQARKGLRTLLIVDEAQGLAVSAIEELRMLSNFQLGGQALLQIFLLGQPEFRELLKSPELEQLRQRVIATHHLEPMQSAEIEPYVQHRLSLVGWNGDPHFAADAFAAIHAATDGVPRRVNAVMSRVLLLGAVDRLHVIDGGAVHAVAADMGLELDGAVNAAADPDENGMADEIFDEAAVLHPAMPLAEAEDVTIDAEFEEAVWSAPQVEGDGQELHRIREELDDMRRMMSLTVDQPGRQHALAERIEAVESRVKSIEARSDDQEAALRRVLTLLVEWVETDGQNIRAA
ncbi:MAG TPA: XrtA/PEP-CTERM system-associated ATPase [Sphingobium sp.]|nr:XrtA/PEP-CTERM system-associated ATPase [Sphingobium sp.]